MKRFRHLFHKYAVQASYNFSYLKIRMRSALGALIVDTKISIELYKTFNILLFMTVTIIKFCTDKHHITTSSFFLAT